MICPLLALAKAEKGWSKWDAICRGSDCAWWVEGQGGCALREVIAQVVLIERKKEDLNAKIDIDTRTFTRI
jgi:hypothetical protein